MGAQYSKYHTLRKCLIKQINHPNRDKYRTDKYNEIDGIQRPKEYMKHQ